MNNEVIRQASEEISEILSKRSSLSISQELSSKSVDMFSVKKDYPDKVHSAIPHIMTNRSNNKLSGFNENTFHEQKDETDNISLKILSDSIENDISSSPSTLRSASILVRNIIYNFCSIFFRTFLFWQIL